MLSHGQKSGAADKVTAAPVIGSRTIEEEEIAPGYIRAPYLQSLSKDSTMIIWIATDTGQPAVDYGETLEYGLTVQAQLDVDRQVAILRNLKPGTRYYYRIRAGNRILAQGPRFNFQTDAGIINQSFNFFVTADVGDKRLRHRYTAESILNTTPRPELGILCGDIVYNKGQASYYDKRLMQPWKDLFCTIPVWPALGNHDWKSSPADNWEREWYLPNNEHYYSFDYGNAHFVALDTRDGSIYDRANQVRWLERDLAANVNKDWIFVYYHHPGITCTYKGHNDAVIEHFLPLFDRYKVDVVFNGHAHTYERLYPIYKGSPVNQEQDPYYTDPQGIIYIVTGAGGKYKKNKPTKLCGPTAFYRDEVLLWTQVFVDGLTCTIRTWESESGDFVDEVEITKTRLAINTPRRCDLSL
jgi:hypothetical protein